MTSPSRRRVGPLAGTALSGCAVCALVLVGTGVLAQGSSMMSTPRPAPAAPVPAAPRAGSSMMNAPSAPAPSPVQPAAPKPIQQPAPPVLATPALPAPPAAPPPAAPVLGPYAVAKTATGFSASNVRMSVGPAEILVPRADIAGSSLGLDEITALLDPASATPLGERLAKLSADEISIPALTIRDPKQVTSITGVRLRQVVAGTVGSVDVAGAVNGQASVSHAAATELDLGLFARLFSPPPGGASTAGAGGKLYGTLLIEGLTGSGAAPGDAFRIARLSGRDVSIAQTQHGWAADMATVASGGPDAASPDLRRASHAAMADLWDAVSLSSLEISGLDTATAAGGKGRIGRLAVTGSSASAGAAILLDDLDVGSDDGRVRVASVAIGNISLGTALAAFRDWSGGTTPDEKTSPAEMRRLMPTVGSFTVTGLGIDTPAGPAGAGPVHVDIASIDARSGRPVDGLPTDMQFAVRNVTVPIAPDAGDDASRQLASLGYAKVTGSFGSSIAWNPATQEIAIRDLSLQAGEMGTVTVRGLIGNVSPDLFNPDSAVASVAAIGLTARALDISVHNDGLAERLLAREAKAQRRRPEDIRRDLGVGAAVMVPTLLGESQASRVLSQALGRFVAKPGTLTVQLKAKQPAGYGFTDYAAAPSPIAALDQFEVTATAE